MTQGRLTTRSRRFGAGCMRCLATKVMLLLWIGSCAAQWEQPISFESPWSETSAVFDRRYEATPFDQSVFQDEPRSASMPRGMELMPEVAPVLEQSSRSETPPLYNVELPEFAEDQQLQTWSDAPESGIARMQWKIVEDHLNFYSVETLVDLGMVTAMAGTLANTAFDEQCRDIFLDNVTHTGSGETARWLHQTKGIGNGFKTLPLFAAAAATGLISDQFPILEPVSGWGSQSLRTFVVGAPVVCIGQLATGGSRPGENDHDSAWRPLADNNGVSGHAFMGAIPFLAAADMTESRTLKTVFIVGSTLPAISRITDDDHYTSQVILGWTIAYVSHRAISKTDRDANGWNLTSWQAADAQGLGFEKRW